MRSHIGAATLILVLALPLAALAADAAGKNTSALAPSGAIAAGRAIAEKHCAACHAIDTTGASPLAKAPPFREITQKYPVRHLEEALAEGIVTGHAAMPAFELEPAEIDALLAFMDTHTPPAK